MAELITNEQKEKQASSFLKIEEAYSIILSMTNATTVVTQ